MNILLVGASGFIGRALALRLRGHHHVVGLSRAPSSDPACDEWRQGDLRRLTHVSAWHGLLAGIDVVINSAGLLSSDKSALTLIHGDGPVAMFHAAKQAGIRRVVQIAALAEHAPESSAFYGTKQIANRALAGLDLDWTIVEPSLVFGPGGKSASFFTMLASLPVIPVPGHGRYRIQPIFIDDLTAAIVRIVESPGTVGRRIPLVGAEPVGIGEFLQQLRRGMQLPATRQVHVPETAMRLAASTLDRRPNSLLTKDTWQLLRAGNTADPAATVALLGHAPRAYAAYVSDDPSGYRQHARARWLLPLLRFSIAAMWVITGLISAFVYPVRDSYVLLARVGLTGAPAAIALYGAAALDIAMGALIWMRPRDRAVWLAQIVLILAYTVIITIFLPEFWAHPFGPVLKNIPLLAALWLLYELE